MTTFGSQLSRIMYSLGDPTEATWSRTLQVWYWLIEAIREFPIPRPMTSTIYFYTDDHKESLPADFIDIVNVEWPLAQEPPSYCKRRDHLDPIFYDDYNYDVDRDYDSGTGWILWMGQSVAAARPVTVNYLALHDTAAAEGMVLTIPDQYLNILTEYCIIRAWTERLSVIIQDPTAHDNTVQRLTDAIRMHRTEYDRLYKQAVEENANSRQTHNRAVDKYDRIY